MIVNIPNVVPANSYWTTKTLVTSLRSMLRDYGGQDLPTYDLRLWLNVGLTRAASFIRQFAPQFYTVRWSAQIVPEQLGSFANLQYGLTQFPYYVINLNEPVIANIADPEKGEKQWPTTIGYSTLNPYKYAAQTLSLQIIHKFQNTTQNFWMGSPQRVDIDKFAAISAGLNDQWRQDIVWTQQDYKVLVWAGNQVLQDPAVGNQALLTNWYKDATVEITLIRKPILDDLLSPDSGLSNWEEMADCPDEAIGLLLQYARETAIGYLGKPEDPNAKAATSMIEQSLLLSLGNVQQPAAQ